MASIRAQLRQSRPASEATLARGASFVLWGLVILAGFGGLSALVRSTSSSGDAETPVPTATTDDGRWIAAGFAERYVGAYLLAGSESTALAAYLGYEPELPATARPAAVAAPVRAVEVTSAGDDYWSVVLAVGPPGQEWFWQAAVDATGDGPVAVGLPSAVSAPPEVERIDLDVNLGPTPADDPAAETVSGFLAAYLCGSGELSRYLSPGVDLAAANPPMCTQVELNRWGSQTDGDTSQIVVVDAALGSGDDNPVWQATYAIELARRDGRWEVAELLPAPPRDGD